MRSLRERLAQFDRSVARTSPPPVGAGAPVGAGGEAGVYAGLIAEGATWVGAPPTGYLRLEAPVTEDVSPPFEAVPVSVWPVLGADVPSGEHWVVLDTETTGLESGTGTLVFVVGLVHWTRAGARRVQLFLPEPAGEAALLAALIDELTGADAFVSYNGRAFDVSRLRARMRLQRLDEDVLERPHLDLVFPARRLLRGTLDDVRLGTLERALIDRRREDDLPGEFAPEVYRNLLADGRDTGLAAVMRHNALDVERLPLLAAWFARTVESTPARDLPPACALQLARLHAQRGCRDRAHALLDELVANGAFPRDVRLAAGRELATSLRRRGRHDAAAAAWRDHIERFPGDLEARVELAKLCEHRLRDLDQAQSLVLGAMRLDRDRRALGFGGEGATRRGELDHRLQRIRHKIARGGDGVR